MQISFPRSSKIFRYKYNSYIIFFIHISLCVELIKSRLVRFEWIMFRPFDQQRTVLMRLGVPNGSENKNKKYIYFFSHIETIHLAAEHGHGLFGSEWTQVFHKFVYLICKPHIFMVREIWYQLCYRRISHPNYPKKKLSSKFYGKISKVGWSFMLKLKYQTLWPSLNHTYHSWTKAKLTFQENSHQ